MRTLLLAGVIPIALMAQPARAQTPVEGPASASVWIEPTLKHPPSGNPFNSENNAYILETQVFPLAPQLWGGAYVDGDRLVVVAITQDVEAAHAELQKAGITFGYEIRSGSHSLVDLEAAVEMIVQANPPGLLSVGPQYSRGALIVRADSIDSHLMNPLISVADRTGVPIAVSVGTQNVTANSRYSNSSPFFGGRLTSFNTSQGTEMPTGCSSAFAWTSPSGLVEMVSASHCYMSPTSGPRNVIVSSSYATIGYVVWASGDANGSLPSRQGDLAVWLPAPGTVSPRVFVGPNNSTNFRSIFSATSLPENWSGTNLRTSGAGGFFGNGDGEIAPDWISLVNQYVNYSNGQGFNGLTFAEHSSDCVGGGDSGGAVYLQYQTSSARALGVISGSNYRGTLWENCRSYYTPLHKLATDFGGSILTF